MTRTQLHRARRRPVVVPTMVLLAAVLTASLAAGASPLDGGPPRGDWRVTAERYEGRGASRDLDVSTLLLERTLPLREWLAIGGGGGVVAVGGGDDAVGAGAVASLRLGPVEVRGVRPFVEGSTGMVFTTDAVPPGGERGNLWHRAALGFTVRLRPSLRLVAAFRRIHVSGDRWLDDDAGRQLDGNGVALGLALRRP